MNASTNDDASSLASVEEAATETFAAAAQWLVVLVGMITAEQWDQRGLGEWNVRELVGHASRALVTVEEYLVMPGAGSSEVALADIDPDVAGLDAVDGASRYFLGTHENPTLHAQVATRGRQAAEELGASPAQAVAQLAGRVVALLERAPSGSVFATRFGTLPYATYLHTRTVELVVHGLDISTACGLAVEVPASPLRVVLEIVAGVARHRGHGAELVRVLGGRSTLVDGFSVFS